MRVAPVVTPDSVNLIGMELKQNTIRRILAMVLLAAALLAAGNNEAKAQQFSIKTNLLMDAAMTPSLGCEIVTGEHSSVDISAFGHYKPYGMDSMLIALQPEYRYWFNGRPMTREYIGGALLLTTYDMNLNKYVYNGDAIGAGLTAGYVISLGDHWNVDFAGGFGVLVFHQKQYRSHDNYDDYFVDEAVKANAWGYKLFPIKLGISISYIIK